MKCLLPKLTEKLQPFHSKASQIPVPVFVKQLPTEDSAVISHLWFWPRLSYFFKPKDVIVTETGSCCLYSWYPVLDFSQELRILVFWTFHCRLVPFWSTKFSGEALAGLWVSRLSFSRFAVFRDKNVGSCLGAALAARDLGLPRVVLFVGDGSL